MYFRRAAEAAPREREIWRVTLFPALATAVAAIAAGVWPSLLMQAASAATATLTGDPA
jgi:hypothetical protein